MSAVGSKGWYVGTVAGADGATDSGGAGIAAAGGAGAFVRTTAPHFLHFTGLPAHCAGILSDDLQLGQVARITASIVFPRGLVQA